MASSNGKTGETTKFVSPYTGQAFGTQFAFNDHMANWPAVCEANGWNLDGSPKVAEASAAPKTKSKGKKGK